VGYGQLAQNRHNAHNRFGVLSHSMRRPVVVKYMFSFLSSFLAERVDNLGAYSIPSGDRLSPSKTLSLGGPRLECH